MLAIEITLNVIVLAVLVLTSIGIGFIFRSAQVNKLKKKVNSLEKEMLVDHAQILDLQKERVRLEQRLTESKIPVIPMNSKEDAEKKKAADAARANS